MQTRRNNQQVGMTLLPSLESIVPETHRLRRLNRVLDLSFVHDAVRDRYCQENGRPSIDPEVIIRLFLLQAILNIPHVRSLMEEVQVNLACRLFIGYELGEKLPDHSTLSKAMERFGDTVFDELFTRSVAQCQQSGLIEGKILHVDATTIRADIDADRVNKPGSSDPDARFGRFPDGTKKPGYKQQTVADDRCGVIVGVSVMPANEGESASAMSVVDDAIERLGETPEVMCADSAYANGENAQGCKKRGIRLVSPPTKPCNHLSGEQFGIEEFSYDERRDLFICPAGQELRRAGRQGRAGRYKYQCLPRICGVCALKSQCTRAAQRSLNASIHHASLVQLRSDSQTSSFWALYRRRCQVIERVFAESKQWHSLRRAWRRGLRKMLIQSLLVASVLNFKRLATAFPAGWSGLTALLRSITRDLQCFWRIMDHYSHKNPLRMTINVCL
jgi:transposase